MSPSRTGEARGAAGALRRLVDKTRQAFHHLARAAEQLHEEERLSAGERGVLIELHESGPRAVPEMARARPVSRQHIQVLVNGLVERGVVEFVDNPRHRRSNLVRLTDRGRKLATRLLERERAAFETLARAFRPAQLEQASDTLEALSRLLEGRSVERTMARARRTSHGS